MNISLCRKKKKVEPGRLYDARPKKYGVDNAGLVTSAYYNETDYANARGKTRGR